MKRSKKTGDNVIAMGPGETLTIMKDIANRAIGNKGFTETKKVKDKHGDYNVERFLTTKGARHVAEQYAKLIKDNKKKLIIGKILYNDFDDEKHKENDEILSEYFFEKQAKECMNITLSRTTLDHALGKLK